MSILGIIRTVVFITATLFAVIVLALSAHLIWFTETQFVYAFYTNYSAMGIATGLLTIGTLPVLLIIDANRKGAVTSMILTEMIILSILWILWLSTASLATGDFTAVANCDLIGDAGYATACHEAQAIEAFSFLNWLMLMAYAFVVLVFSFIAAARGHSTVWTSSVKTTNFFAPSVQAQQQPMAPGMVPQMGMPVQQQYPPNFAPQQQPSFIPGASPAPMYPAGTPISQGYAPTPPPGQGPYAQV
jgi:hypothetical protein